MTLTPETEREARSVEIVPYSREPMCKRANAPGDYVCPCCGEHLSGPARFYTCPNANFGERVA